MGPTELKLVTGESLTKRVGHCRKCGTVTSAKDGLCRACHCGFGFPDPKRATTPQLAEYARLIREELIRRRAEIDSVLREEG